VWRVFWPAALVWVVLGVLLVVEGDTLARVIGVVFLATWLFYAREPLRRIYRRSVALLRRPRPRLAAAVVILAVALAGAAYLHWHQTVYHCPPESLVLCSYTKKPSWADPTALALCLVGVVTAGAALVTARRSRN
jgi:hypothetical protein